MNRHGMEGLQQEKGTLPDRVWEKYYSSAADARRLTRTPLICYALLYGLFAICIVGKLPMWTLWVSAPILVVRWLLATHELMHVRNEREVDWLTRLMPLLLTPFSLGYREYLDIHRGHHRHMATPQDPEYFQLRGNKLQGLLNAMTAPEQAFLRWVVREGVDAELMMGVFLRAGLFVLLWALSGVAFWGFWIPMRLAYGASYFAFFYALHRRGSNYGVYRVTLSAGVERLFTLLFGREALLATRYHDIHHGQPRISALHLPAVARDLPQEGLPLK